MPLLHLDQSSQVLRGCRSLIQKQSPLWMLVEAETNLSTTYSDRLKHWMVAPQFPQGENARLLPKMQRVAIERSHRRADTDGHLYFLRQRIPDGIFIVVFDIRITSGTIQEDVQQID